MRQNPRFPLVLSCKMVKETSMAEHEVCGTKMTSESDLPGDKLKKRRTKTERVKLFKERVKTGVREEREITDLQSRYETIDTSLIKNFRDFPLSKKTLRGLSDSGYKVPTDIQKEAIGLALRKLDVLGAAQTGSGKTLAFLVPIIEILYCKSWTRLDGLGAIIITPTRELAYQIFETLRKIGRHHEFSAGLIIGGKDMKYESRRLHQCNIMICTPGRLLHHMDENPLLDPTSLQMLVIDEADRCLDLGFQHTMNGIIENLPPNRQTLLFSATQTKSVKDLARLSLKDPMYVSVHEHAKHSTPEGLQQSYMVSPAEHKIDLLWSFVKNHRKHKTIVFLTSCKQVRFAHHAFCRLRPGYSIMALHGGLHQLKRMAVYEEFCRKEHAVLLATDIAARGLDFPDVNWVLQLDCPEDAASYVHRAGRTARYTQGGEALLVLLPSEEQAMLERLKDRKVPINKIEVNPRKLVSIQRKLEAMLARDAELKAMAQRALVTYMKATFLMKDKSVFDVSQIDLQALSRSYGLAVAPRVRFLQKQGISLNKPKADSDEAHTEPELGTDALAQGKDTTTFDFGIEESDEDILMVKRKDHALSDDDYEDLEEEKKKKNRILTKEAVAKRILKKKIKANKNVQFDEEGDRIFDPIKERVTEAARNYEFGEDDLNTTSGINIEKAREILREEDQVDKQVFRARIKAKHREERLKAKAERRQASQPEEEEAEDVEAAYESDDSITESVADIIDALPDPDRIYGAKEGYHESESEGEENFVAVEPKRKKKSVKSVKAKKRKLESATFDSGLDLQDEEQLALQLLQH